MSSTVSNAWKAWGFRVAGGTRQWNSQRHIMQFSGLLMLDNQLINTQDNSDN